MKLGINLWLAKGIKTGSEIRLLTDGGKEIIGTVIKTWTMQTGENVRLRAEYFDHESRVVVSKVFYI